MRSDCLIEIGTEELPPRALQALSDSLADQVDAGLRELGLEAASVERFATPRRLAVLLREVPLQQQDQVQHLAIQLKVVMVLQPQFQDPQSLMLVVEAVVQFHLLLIQEVQVVEETEDLIVQIYLV